MKFIIFTPNDNTGGTERVSSIYAHALSNQSSHIKVCSIFKPLRSYDALNYPHLHFSLKLASYPRIFRPFILYLCFIYYHLRGYRLFMQGEYPAAISFSFLSRYLSGSLIYLIVFNLLSPFFILFLCARCRNMYLYSPSLAFKESFPISVRNYHILPNPFQPPTYPSPTYKISHSSSFSFIAVGQLNYQKNHSFLISTFSKFVLNYSPLSRLYIYGEGPMYDELFALISSLNMTDNIFLMGWSPNPWIDQHYDFHLLTSRWEGYPNVIIESSFHCIPTLLIPIDPGVHSLITENNIGYSAANRHPDSFLQLLIHATLHNKYSFSTTAFRRFVELHSPDQLITLFSTYV